MVGSQGEHISNQTQIGSVFCDYFSQLFTSSNPQNIEEWLRDFLACVNSDMNHVFSIPFTTDDVTKSIFQMNSLGAWN